jgi:PAS domain-containing protein
MSQREIELILIRQLASYLAMPMFIVDMEGVLVFYNEAAEGVLGRRFEETGEMMPLEWASAWAPVAEDGRPVPAEELPLWIALHERRPFHLSAWIQGLDRVRRHVEAVAFPLEGHAGRLLGATVIFWELDR